METLQRTPEWFAARLYKYTASGIHKLFTEPRSKAAKDAGELSDTAKTYIIEKIAEELGVETEQFTTKDMQWGIEQEPNAKEWYEIMTGRKVGEVGFIDYNEFFGGSPDAGVFDPELALQGEYGIINCGLEVKCPKTTTHLKYCLIDSDKYFKENHPDHYWQCTSHCITLNVNCCDFISYDPRINHAIGLFIHRMKRNEDDVKLLLSKIPAANKYKDEVKTKLKLI